MPIKIFESSDVVFKDTSRERQARNVRQAAAVWCNKTAGFEVVHGMLDRAMQMLEVPLISSSDKKALHGCYIKEREGECSRFPLSITMGSRTPFVLGRSNLLPWSRSHNLLP